MASKRMHRICIPEYNIRKTLDPPRILRNVLQSPVEGMRNRLDVVQIIEEYLKFALYLES